MGYSRTTFLGRSDHLLSLDDEHELEVMFAGYAGYDLEAYGDTYVKRYDTSIDEVEGITLDGKELTMQELVNRFGYDKAQAAVKDARDSAEEA